MKTSKFSNCTSCPLLNQIMVHGETNVPHDLSLVKLLILAEAPATKEVELGLPLKGKAGKGFRSRFESSCLDTVPYFINNVVMCANLYKDPVTGRIKTDNPPSEAVDCCKPNWEALVKILQPEYILIMGGTTQEVFGITGTISDSRGKLYPYPGDTSGMKTIPKVFLTFHPSYITRGTAPKHKIEQFNEDFDTLYEMITGISEKQEKKKTQRAKLSMTKPYTYSLPKWIREDDVSLIDIQKHPKSNTIVYIFRDKDNNRKYHTDKSGEYYYYRTEGKLGDSPVLIPVSETELVLNKPIYNKHEARYESDNKLAHKHSIDYYIQRKNPEINIPLVKLFFDIEIYSGGSLEFPDPKVGPKPINAISFKIGENPVNVYLVNPTNLIKKEDVYNIEDKLKDIRTDFEVSIFDTEKKLLEAFCKLIKTSEPDLLMTWNGTGFDIPYIYNRLKKNSIDPSSMSPLGCTHINVHRFGDITIMGTYHLDMLEAYKDLTENKKETYALGAIAVDELGEGKVEFEGSLDLIYEKDIERFIKYSGQDTNLLYELDVKKGHADLKNELRRVCSSNWKGTESTTGLLDPLVISYAKNKGMVIRNSEMHKSNEKLKGAYVKVPNPGIYKWLVDFDYSSLYPSTIISLNIGPDTLIGKIDPEIAKHYIYGRKIPDKVEVNITPMNTYDSRFKTMTKDEFIKWVEYNNAIVSIVGTIFMGHDKKISFMSEICSLLLGTRAKLKDKMNKAKEENDPIWKLFYNQQWAYKILANSLYGVLGTFSFRLFKLDLAKTITGTAQEALKFAMHHTSKYMKTGEKTVDLDYIDGDFDRDIPYVIYGDTDSNFINIAEYLINQNINI